MTAGLTRSERIADLRDFHGAIPVESPAEMRRQVSATHRAVLDGVRFEPTVEGALERRRLMRRSLGKSWPQRAPEQGAMDVLSLCSGIGGLDIGLKIAVPEARVVAYVEGAAPCQEVLLTRMADGVLDRAPIYGNIESFDGEPWRGLVDCVVGGYPCQPVSDAGKRRGADDPRYLWPHVARIVGAIEPEWCLFENVAGHLSLGCPDVVGDLAAMGYRVALGLFTARELGATHERERLFILGHRDALGPAALQQREPVARREGGGRAGVQPIGGIDAETRGQEAVPAAPSVAAVGNPGRRPVPDGERSGLRRPQWGYPCSWPPRPGSWRAWRGVRAVDPSLVPAAEAAINPAFVEWLMGFPRGWTEGLPRAARVRMLGNAVVPAMAALAWEELSSRICIEAGYTE